MTISQFKKIARLLKQVYAELEKEALDAGISLLSPEYTELVDKARLAVLEKHGFTLEEYREVKEKVTGIDKAGTLAVMEDTQKKLKEIDDKHIPTAEEIKELAHEVAKEYIVPPKITNEIVKEITIEKPQIIETIREVVRETSYDDTLLNEKVGRALQQLDEIKIPEPLDIAALKAELKSDFSVFFEHNINTLDMPNFRKLAMGLQAQIDAGGSGGGTWGSITGTLADQTDLQSALDLKSNSSGALTQFVGNGNWKVFYSNGSGDVTELTVGAAGTFLQGNGVSSAPTWGTPAGSGDVTKVGTPVNKQVGFWTGDGTLAGSANFTYDDTTEILTVPGGIDTGDTSVGILTVTGAAIEMNENATINFNTGGVAELQFGQAGEHQIFFGGSSGINGIIDMASLATSDKTFVFPNASGTIALSNNVALITVADEASDTTTFIGFYTAATGNLQPKTNAGLTFNSSTAVLTATGFSGPLTGNVTGNVSGTAATVTTAAQSAITSLGTLTVLQVDNININGNTISSTAGTDLLITPLAGQQLILDGTIEIDAGVVTGATSITSTAFVGDLTGNVTGNTSGTAATVTTAAQPAITSLGTLTTLQVDNILINGNDISSTAGTDLTITPLAGQQIVLDGTIVIDAGVVTGATSITSTAFVGDLTGNVTGNASGTAATVTGATQAAITTLANLVSVQGLTVTLADAGADAILGWDDSASAYENLTQAEVLAVIGDSSDTAKGVVELATTAETATGTDAGRAVTPDGLHDMTTLAGAGWFLDEDDMVSNSAVKTASQQSIKAYVDAFTGATPALDNLASVAINTTLVSDTYNTDALGTSAIAWSDLFLGSGAVIDFSSAASTSDVTITHSSNTLTIAGATSLAMGTSMVVGLGSIELGHATDTTVARSSAGVISVEGVTLSRNSTTADHIGQTFELGHASDTTLARVSAGVVSIEGVTIATATNTLTMSAKTLTAPVINASTITGNQNIAAVPASDHTANGPTTSIFNLGATIALMDLVYLGSSSKWLLTDADAASTATGMLGICLDGGGDTDTTTVALAGAFVRDDTWNWTPGAILYVDTATPGALTATQPSGADDVARIIGYAVTADVIWFNPENDWITHT